MFQKSKPLRSVFLLLLLLLGAGLVSFYYLLPLYIEKKVLPDFGRQLTSSLSGRVYSLGFSAADIGGISLGDPQNPAVSIGMIHADYRLSALLKKKIDHIEVNGLRLNLNYLPSKTKKVWNSPISLICLTCRSFFRCAMVWYHCSIRNNTF